ncbi:MAG: hypothetical protein EA397_01835 [Deltaproteobacteria bacterium]|nr:MAG: hypothetical protein EA397_01835 [Deltaproteobacteria bacterium]
MIAWVLLLLALGIEARAQDAPEASPDTTAPAEADPVAKPDPLKRLPKPKEAAEKAPPPERLEEVQQEQLEEAEDEDAPPDWDAIEVGVDLTPPYDDEDVDEEVTVWGTAAIRQARDRLVLRMISAGWDPKSRKEDGTIVFKGPESWMGAAMISPDGMLEFRRSYVSVGRQYDVPLPPGAQSAARDRSLLNDPSSGRVGGITGPASKRKLRGVRQELQREVEDDLRHMRRVLSETVLQERLSALPDKLDRLWREGLALKGTEPLATHADRRAAVIDYWASRPDSRDGRMTQRVVSDWAGQVVQNSPHPFTPEEIEYARTQRPDLPPLVQER